jgi:hypothetical protein
VELINSDLRAFRMLGSSVSFSVNTVSIRNTLQLTAPLPSSDDSHWTERETCKDRALLPIAQVWDEDGVSVPHPQKCISVSTTSVIHVVWQGGLGTLSNHANL